MGLQALLEQLVPPEQQELMAQSAQRVPREWLVRRELQVPPERQELMVQLAPQERPVLMEQSVQRAQREPQVRPVPMEQSAQREPQAQQELLE